jgi:hypothetical protein
MPEAVSAAVIGFESHKARTAPRREPRSLMEAVYSAGSVVLRADDRSARMVAAILGRLGFFCVDEMRPDGAVRRLGPSEMRLNACAHPWRVSKADFAGDADRPDEAPGHG